MKIGGKTVGDIRQLLTGRPDDQMIWLEGFDFHVCEHMDGTLEIYRTQCPKHMMEVM